MNKIPAISIIVPIYNMERCLSKCINSILLQSFRDFELLLIDDGSTDSSSAIVDEFTIKDSRIKAFHKQNGGLSDARNYGLSHAKGKYTIFVDPDDWVSPKGLDRLYDRAEKEDADMTICDLYREDEYSRHYVLQKPSNLHPQDVLKEMFERLGGFTVNKLIKRELYQRFCISFPEGIYGCEDLYTMVSFLLHDIKIAYEPVAYYHYMYNANSLSRFYDEKTYDMDVHIEKMFGDLLKDNPLRSYVVEKRQMATFTRAFWNGGDFFDSKTFKSIFRGYKPKVNRINESFFMKKCLYLSCCGYYMPCNRLVMALFRVKRFMKKMKYRLKKKI